VTPLSLPTPLSQALVTNAPQDGVVVRTTEAGRPGTSGTLPAMEERWHSRFGDGALAERRVGAALPRTATTGAATAEPDPAAARGKVLRLTDKGSGRSGSTGAFSTPQRRRGGRRTARMPSTTSGGATRCRSTRWSRTAGYPDGS